MVIKMKGYIPENVKDYYVPISFKDGDNVISEGSLRCSCLSNTFSVQYFGQIGYGLWKPHIFPTDENLIFLMISCDKCGKNICLFDSRTDGNDAVAEILEKKTTPVSFLTDGLNIFNCPKCKESHFVLKVKCEHSPKKEIIECGIQDYPNTFGWVWVDLISGSYKRTSKSFWILKQDDYRLSGNK